MYKYFNDFNDLFYNLIFLFNIIYIFSSEIFLFYFYDFCICITKEPIIANNNENDYILYEKMINNITHRLASLNILYVKIFQAIALNNNFIDDKINNQLLKFTDNAPYNYNDIDYKNLENICKNYNLYIKDYDNPINSGMISLVYKAIDIKQHRNLIIKIKRKDIEKKLEYGIKNLIFITKLISLIPFIERLKLNNIINKNIDLIKSQTNFINEIANMTLIKNNCKGLKYIVIPEPLEDATIYNPNVIIMDYINGKKITEINKDDYYDFAKMVVKFGLITSFIHGVTHGDLHSGNILFIDNDNNNSNNNNSTKYIKKLGIIDFGIIYEFNNELREGLIEIFMDFNNNEISSKKIVINILNLILEPYGILNKLNKIDYDKIINSGINILDEIRNSREKTNQIYFYKFLNDLNKYLNKSYIKKLGIYINENFIKLQLAVAMSQGITLNLCGNNIMDLTDKTMKELFNPLILNNINLSY